MKTKCKPSFSMNNNSLLKEINPTTKFKENILKNKKRQKQNRNILEIYFSNWQKIFTLKGRANRIEFLIFLSITLLFFNFTNLYSFSYPIIYIFIFTLFSIALFSLTVRRFHDQNKSALSGSILFGFIFFIILFLSDKNYFSILYILGIFVYFICCLKKGTIGKNKYGNQPIPASKIALFLSLFLCIPFLISLWHLTKVIIIYFKGA